MTLLPPQMYKEDVEKSGIKLEKKQSRSWFVSKALPSPPVPRTSSGKLHGPYTVINNDITSNDITCSFQIIIIFKPTLSLLMSLLFFSIAMVSVLA